MIMTSEEAAHGWNKPIRLLWIDGDHRHESTKLDFALWEPHVVEGGILAMHDTIRKVQSACSGNRVSLGSLSRNCHCRQHHCFWDCIDASGDRVVSRVMSADHFMVDLVPARAGRDWRQETTIEWLTALISCEDKTKLLSTKCYASEVQWCW